jgi:hypothetical protein
MRTTRALGGLSKNLSSPNGRWSPLRGPDAQVEAQRNFFGGSNHVECYAIFRAVALMVITPAGNSIPEWLIVEPLASSSSWPQNGEKYDPLPLFKLTRVRRFHCGWCRPRSWSRSSIYRLDYWTIILLFQAIWIVLVPSEVQYGILRRNSIISYSSALILCTILLVSDNLLVLFPSWVNYDYANDACTCAGICAYVQYASDQTLTFWSAITTSMGLLCLIRDHL